MSDQGWIVRGPRWWLIVRLVGAIVSALALLFDIAWKLVVGFPAGPDSLAGGARWLVLVCEGVGMAVVVYSAVGGVIAAGIWALPGSTVDMEHGLWPVVRTAWQLSGLAVVFGWWPWWDAGRVLGLHDGPAEPDGPGAGVSR